jgi:hypothetical protein
MKMKNIETSILEKKLRSLPKKLELIKFLISDLGVDELIKYTEPTHDFSDLYKYEKKYDKEKAEIKGKIEGILFICLIKEYFLTSIKKDNVSFEESISALQKKYPESSVADIHNSIFEHFVIFLNNLKNQMNDLKKRKNEDFEEYEINDKKKSKLDTNEISFNLPENFSNENIPLDLTSLDDYKLNKYFKDYNSFLAFIILVIFI